MIGSVFLNGKFEFRVGSRKLIVLYQPFGDGDPLAGVGDSHSKGYVALDVGNDFLTIHRSFEGRGVDLEHLIERLMDCQLIRKFLVFVGHGNNGITIVISLVLIDIERD